MALSKELDLLLPMTDTDSSPPNVSSTTEDMGTWRCSENPTNSCCPIALESKLVALVEPSGEAISKDSKVGSDESIDEDRFCRVRHSFGISNDNGELDLFLLLECWFDFLNIFMMTTSDDDIKEHTIWNTFFRQGLSFVRSGPDGSEDHILLASTSGSDAC